MSLHIIVDIVGRHLTPINRQETGMKKNVVESEKSSNFAIEMLKNGFLTKKSLSFIIHFSKKGEYGGRRQYE